jgi:prolyl oligopeptidase
LVLGCAGLLLVAQACGPAGEKVPPPPETKVVPVSETIQGLTITDPYRWLEDQNSPETRAWIDAQNAYTSRLLDKAPGREEIRASIAGLMKPDNVGTPAPVAGRYFFLKRRADEDVSVLYVRKGLRGPDEVLIDPRTISPDGAAGIGLMDISKDGTMLLYAVRKGTEAEVEVRLFDVDGRRTLPDVLPRAVYYATSLSLDKKSVYYSRREPGGPRLYRHVVGTDPGQDRLVFGQGLGPEAIVSAGLSENGRWLTIYVVRGSASERVEVHVQDLVRGGPIRPLVQGVAARFLGFFGGDKFYAQTNWNAPNGRVIVLDPLHPDPAEFREVVPARKDALIQGLSGAGGKLFVTYLKGARTGVEIFDPDGTPRGELNLPAIGSVGALNGRWDGGELFYSFSSFCVPTTIYRYSTGEGTQAVWFEPRVSVDASRCEVKQVWYPSKDGTDIPMFIVAPKGLKLDGSRRVLLTGYGGWGVSQAAAYSVTAAAWLERGGVFAVPCLRGGGEFGEKWHRAGMLENKQNVFDDFIAAAEYLIRAGYTRPAGLGISGGSNGGLLVGAALAQRPGLFGAAVCSYPLLDMLRYHMFGLGKYWTSEYGSAENPAQFRFLYAYSPYQHLVKGTKYPAVLFASGDADNRHDALHARKMTALLQADSASGRPVLLRYRVLGPAGAAPVNEALENLTDQLSFLSWQLR